MKRMKQFLAATIAALALLAACRDGTPARSPLRPTEVARPADPATSPASSAVPPASRSAPGGGKPFAGQEVAIQV